MFIKKTFYRRRGERVRYRNERVWDDADDDRSKKMLKFV